MDGDYGPLNIYTNMCPTHTPRHTHLPPSPLWLSVMDNGNYPEMITPGGSPMQLLQHFVSICGCISVLLLTHPKISFPHLQAGHILQASLPGMGIHLGPLAIPSFWYSYIRTNHIVHQRQSKGRGHVWRGPMQRRANDLWLKSLPKLLRIIKEPCAIFEPSFLPGLRLSQWRCFEGDLWIKRC